MDILTPAFILAALALAQAAYKYNLVPSRVRPYVAIAGGTLVSLGVNINDLGDVEMALAAVTQGLTSGGLAVTVATLYRKSKQIATSNGTQASYGCGGEYGSDHSPIPEEGHEEAV